MVPVGYFLVGLAAALVVGLLIAAAARLDLRRERSWRRVLERRLDRCCPVCRQLPPVAPRITFTEV